MSRELDVILEEHDGQLLAGLRSGDVSAVLAAPSDVDQQELEGAVDDLQLELEHTLEVIDHV